MKAITLHQPWATLIAIGRKRHETRHWPVPWRLIGERVAIHAGKTIDTDAVFDFGLDPHLVRHHAGKIVATAVLESALQVESHRPGPVRSTQAFFGQTRGVAPVTLAIDKYGDWSVGRWIWCLADIEALQFLPVPVRGRQAFWNVPPEVLDEMPGYGA